MKKQDIITQLKRMKTGFESNLNKSVVHKFYRSGFCYWLHESLSRGSIRERRAILLALKEDIRPNSFHFWHSSFFYPTIETHGFYKKNQKTLLEKLFGLSKNKIKANNVILQRRIDHLDRTIERLKKEELLEIIVRTS